MRTTTWFLGPVVVALVGVLFCPAAQASPSGRWCFNTPIGKVCIPLDNIDLGPMASPEDECRLYPPGPRCVDPTIPPNGYALTPLPGGLWSLNLPDGKSVSPVTPVLAGSASHAMPSLSDSWDGRGQRGG